MDKMEKKVMMDKMLRELEDIRNSQVSLLKKVAQLEADNINLGDREMEKQLPDLHASIDEGVEQLTALNTTFQTKRDKFVADNNLDAELSEEAQKS